MLTIHIDENGQAAVYHDIVQSVSITHLLQQRGLSAPSQDATVLAVKGPCSHAARVPLVGEVVLRASL